MLDLCKELSNANNEEVHKWISLTRSLWTMLDDPQIFPHQFPVVMVSIKSWIDTTFDKTCHLLYVFVLQRIQDDLQRLPIYIQSIHDKFSCLVTSGSHISASVFEHLNHAMKESREMYGIAIEILKRETVKKP
jgi:hypothetical protein